MSINTLNHDLVTISSVRSTYSTRAYWILAKYSLLISFLIRLMPICNTRLSNDSISSTLLLVTSKYNTLTFSFALTPSLPFVSLNSSLVPLSFCSSDPYISWAQIPVSGPSAQYYQPCYPPGINIYLDNHGDYESSRLSSIKQFDAISSTLTLLIQSVILGPGSLGFPLPNILFILKY